ncbi:MAG TPA: hypothetical protein VN541_14075 [Tepidisphaeraceae bacterium]|nr:hypothetical protein [Tepidisphaeraceae bacterium]
MTLRGHIKNRTVVLDDPVNLPEGTDVEVEVRPTAEATPHQSDDPRDWERFVAETAGAWQGEPLTRPPQGDFETRENWG